MAKHIAIGKPVNEFEINAIAFLTKRLPDSFTIISNFEIKQGKEIFEIDLAIIAPQCVFVVDIKNLAGHVEIYDRWIPENREPFSSPLAKLRGHAKSISSLITNANKAQSHNLRNVHVQAVILFTSLHTTFTDHHGRDEMWITYLDNRGLEFFQSSHDFADHRLKDIRNYASTIENAIRGKSQPKSVLNYYRDWILDEKLGGGDRFEEYRAKHKDIPAQFARLRIYQADPYPDPDDPDPEKQRIRTTFSALRQIKHPNIQGVSEFFETENGDRFVLVLEDIEGRSLYQASPLLSITQKFDILNQVLGAMDYAHQHDIIHRNLSADCILVTHNRSQAIITSFEYARNRDRTHTIAHEIIDSIDYSYQPPECQQDPAKASIASDLFSIGAIFYYVFTGRKLLIDKLISQGKSQWLNELPSQLNPEISTHFDDWFRKICAKNPENRYSSADQARQALTPIATSKTISLDNLPIDYLLNNQYVVKQKLGKIGSFCVTYKVWDTTGEVYEVLKLVLRDRTSQYERAKQEYKILRKLPEHPHIVKVRFQGQLHDETPFIVFDYVEGCDLSSLLAEKDLSIDQAVAIAKQTAQGLAHLHKNSVYHQDIKPSNLLITHQEDLSSSALHVKIIDFNIAVADVNESPISAGTKRYLSPDFDFKSVPSIEQKIDRDLYALGITFYECVTGRYPFTGMAHDVSSPAQHPSDLQLATPIPQMLGDFLCKAIAPIRGDRFETADAFLSALDLALIPVIEPLAIAQTGNILEVQIPEKQPKKNLSNNSSSKAKTCLDSQLFFEKFHTSNPLPKEITTQFIVILDPTGNYQAPQCYEVITSELAWMQKFAREEQPYWISGTYLCDLTRKWLSLRDQSAVIIEEKLEPIIFLASHLGFNQEFNNNLHGLETSKFEQWQESHLHTLCDRLSHHIQAKSNNSAITALLGDITSESQIWSGVPSIEHLAHWLLIDVHPDFAVFQRYWQRDFIKQVSAIAPELEFAYQIQDKRSLLKAWIGLPSALSLSPNNLGAFPLALPSDLQKGLGDYWEKQILESEGAILDSLDVQLPNIDEITKLSYNLLAKNPEWIVGDRLHRLPYSVNQREKLTNLLTPETPLELLMNSSIVEAINWAIEQYLPFRRWEVSISKRRIQERQSDHLGESFARWLYQQYPTLKTASVIDSPLNYSTAYLVSQLAKTNPVLWVVVDGLGWLDHQELLQYLTQGSESEHSLKIESELSPRLSILPTKTEYAKWSLYTQLPCDRSDWSPEIAQAFPQMGIGERYTDNRRNVLHADLQSAKHSLFCWDTVQFDHLYHESRDWHSLYKSDRPAILRQLSEQIYYCIQQHPNPQSLKVVIASDHGQLMGEVPVMPNPPKDVEASGRVAIGRTNDPRCFVLEAKAFGLPEDMSVPIGNSCFSILKRTTEGMGIGLHGGLFPEEALIGVSVLSQVVERKPISISISGNGKAKQSDRLQITIDNRLNMIAICDLTLSINEIPELMYGKAIARKLGGGRKDNYTIDINFPELPANTKDVSNYQYKLTGELCYRFADGEKKHLPLPENTYIAITQMFTSGFAGGLDEFF